MPNPYFDALNYGTPLNSTSINYFFDNGGGGSWNAYERQQFALALQQWADVANISFAEVNNLAASNFQLTQISGAQMAAQTGSSSVLGFFEFPVLGGARQTGTFNYEALGWDENNANGGLEQGGYGFVTILHEVGHGLGLAHPHDTAGSSGLIPGVRNNVDTDLGTNSLNQGIYTTMSYNDGRAADGLSPSTNPGSGWQGGPMAFDIYAIQQLYGANTSFQTGNNVYELPTSNAIGSYYEALWDAGGTDTIVNNSGKSALIDLNAATLISGDPNAGGILSTVAGVYGGYTIANGVVIENATGGWGLIPLLATAPTMC